jgi:hypothetical protein
MQRPILPLSVLLLASTSSAFAQHWIVSAGMNYGSYSMKSLKEVQRSVLSSEIPLEIVESFPSRAGLEVNLLRSFGKFSVGIGFLKYSTGGRVSYADYSGSINHDIIANNMMVSLPIEYALTRSESWELFFAMRNGVAVNTMTYRTTLKLGDATDNLQNKFKSMNFAIAPGLGARFFYKNFFLHPEVRYESHLIKGNLVYSNDSDATLEVDGKKVQMDWDGIRLSISLGYRI